MSEWKEYRFSDVIELIGGGTPKTSVNGYWNGNIPWLSVADFNTGKKYVSNTEKTITEKGLSESSTKLLNKNDIIISARGTVGALAVLSRPMTFNQSCYGIRAKEEFSLNDFIYYLLKDTVSGFQQIAHGGVFDTITKDTFNEIEISLPPLPEQKAIASVLSSLDDKIDLLHRQNETLEKMAETLFRQWFVEEAKEDWEEVVLGEYISVKHGFAFKGDYISTGETHLKLVTPGNFKIGGGFKSDKFKYYTREDFPKEYIFKVHDLVVTMTDLSVDGDTLGYSALIPDNYKDEMFLHNQRVGKVEIKKEISKFFLYYLLKTEDYQWFILSGASGTSIRHTSPTSICSYSFKLPSKDKLDKFEKKCSIIQDKIRINQNQIQTLNALRNTLLPKLMSGEVKVEK